MMRIGTRISPDWLDRPEDLRFPDPNRRRRGRYHDGYGSRVTWSLEEQ